MKLGEISTFINCGIYFWPTNFLNLIQKYTIYPNNLG
jgi:hypothetical protein